MNAATAVDENSWRNIVLGEASMQQLLNLIISIFILLSKNTKKVKGRVKQDMSGAQVIDRCAMCPMDRVADFYL